MLIETLDTKENDVVIFSENKLDLKNNFKVIFKSSGVKKEKSIDYFEVCKFLTDPVPKNLVVYRTLTNVTDLDAFTTNYGYFLNTGSNMELVYFDPVFAIQDLSHLKFDLNPQKFRFKVQQVGFTSTANEEGEAIFEEVYSFDLKAIETKTRNDRILAEAIFASDNKVVWNTKKEKSVPHDADILADSSKSDDEMVKANINQINKYQDVNSRNIDKLKESIKKEWQSGFEAYNQFKVKSSEKSKRTDKKTRTFSEFIEEHKREKTDTFREKGKKIEGKRHAVILRFKTRD